MKSSHEMIFEFLANHRIDRLPAAVVHEAKRALMDTLGCIIAGLDTPLGSKLASLHDEFLQSPGATVLGIRPSVSHFFAAMCNAYMANAYDADDGHRMSRVHAGGIIIPAAMAAAEKKDCSGSRFIEAIVVGYELGLRAGIASNLGDIYYGSAFGGAFGATAAFGWILGLAPEQIIQALGITEMHAPNSMLMGWIESRQIPMIKEGMGWAAASGVIGALMAQTGITGTLTIFNDRENSVGLDGLGRDYEIERRYYKPQPGCRWTHAPARTLMNLLEEYKLSAADVAGIEVRTFDKAAKLDNQKPSSMEEAQYSIPFVLGSILAEGQFGPDQMRQDKLNSPHILKQAGKISLKVEPAFSKLYPALAKCEVVLKTKSGRMVSSDADNVQGDWDLPLSEIDLKDKFVLFTRNRFNARQLETVIHHICSIEATSSVCEFIKAINYAIISD
jgi:2-methylcitrate dehydratase PrpD